MDRRTDKKFEKVLFVMMALALAALPLLYKAENGSKTSEINEGLIGSDGMINHHPGIMRFHVVANSDSEEDQELKLAVRNYVLAKVQNEITHAISQAETDGKNNISGNNSKNRTGTAETLVFSEASDNYSLSCFSGAVFSEGKAAAAVSADENSRSYIMRRYIKDNLPKIQAWAQEVIDSAGFEYNAEASVGIRHIPAKYYDDIYFPEGNYEALTITLGEGKGKNWWCVVFPPLCLIDSEDSAYKEEFNIGGEERLELKFKTLELLSGESGIRAYDDKDEPEENGEGSVERNDGGEKDDSGSTSFCSGILELFKRVLSEINAENYTDRFPETEQ